MTDDQDGFTAPKEVAVPSPMAIKLAGLRLYAYAVSSNYPKGRGLLAMPIGDDVDDPSALKRDQRLLAFWLETLR